MFIIQSKAEALCLLWASETSLHLSKHSQACSPLPTSKGNAPVCLLCVLPKPNWSWGKLQYLPCFYKGNYKSEDFFFLQGKLLEPFQLVCQQSSWSWTRTVVSHPNCHSVPKARGKFTEDFFFHSIERLKEWKLFPLPWIWPWLKTAIFDPHRLHHLRIPIAWHKKGSWADLPSNQFLQDSRWGLTMSSRPTSPRLFT